MRRLFSSQTSEIDRILGRAVEEGHVPGVVATVTNREGIIYEGAFGWRMLGSNLPMMTDTVVWLALMSKALTATAVMQMVERGRLQLDAYAAEIVPELAGVQVLLGFDAEGRPKMRLPKRPVTLRHLLAHTSGCAYELWSAALLDFKQHTGMPSILSVKMRLCAFLSFSIPEKAGSMAS